MTTFPANPATSLRLMDIAIDLENINSNSIIGLSIRSGVKDGKIKEVVKMIQDQLIDAPDRITDIVGYKTINKIKAL